MNRRRWLMGIGIALVSGAILFVVNELFGGADGTQVLLSPVRDAAWAELRERRVCAACVPAMTERERHNPTYWDGQVCQWWLLATPGTGLYTELVGAKTVMFELDNGSGPGRACLSKEVRFSSEGSNPIQPALAQCGWSIRRSSLRGGPEEQVAFAVWNSSDERCAGVASEGKPANPELQRTIIAAEFLYR
jgi:hypothetical protein